MILRTGLLLFLLGTIYSVPVPYDMIDMTHTFDNTTLHWPILRKFQSTIVERGTQKGFWLQLDEYSASTHAGTHMDAPCMFARGRWCIDEIPIDRFIAPAAVIDIRRQVAMNRDYMTTIEDLINWEINNRRSLNGMIVLMKSGWGRRWGNPVAFIGSAGNDSSQYHFPGIAPQAAEFLVNNRAVLGVGTEALSVDIGPDDRFTSHRILFSANIFALDNLANVEMLPSNGATLHMFPMKIGYASGAPLRIVATIPRRY